MDWYEWILKKYIEFRGDATGHERSITDFANAIGISQPLMAQWMKKGGKKPRNASSLNHLVAYFGYEVYDVLGLPRPSVVEIDGVALLKASKELAREMKSSGIDEDDPRYESLAREIFGKFGIKVDKM